MEFIVYVKRMGCVIRRVTYSHTGDYGRRRMLMLRFIDDCKWRWYSVSLLVWVKVSQPERHVNRSIYTIFFDILLSGPTKSWEMKIFAITVAEKWVCGWLWVLLNAKYDSTTPLRERERNEKYSSRITSASYRSKGGKARLLALTRKTQDEHKCTTQHTHNLHKRFSTASLDNNEEDATKYCRRHPIQRVSPFHGHIDRCTLHARTKAHTRTQNSNLILYITMKMKMMMMMERNAFT